MLGFRVSDFLSSSLLVIIPGSMYLYGTYFGLSAITCTVTPLGAMYILYRHMDP